MEEVFEDGKKANGALKGRKEDLGNYRLVSLTLVPGKVTIRKEYFWKPFSKCKTGRRVTRSSQHGFMKGK